jgi:hypothetical protein
MTERIKKYIDCWVPVRTCNFRCHYCYVAQTGDFKSKLPEFKYSAEYIAKALSKRRLGGTCFINLCGSGETLLPPQIIGIIRTLLEEGHYIAVVTNGSLSNRFDEICAFPDEILSRLFIKFSFHYLELKRLDIMDKFFHNIHKIQNAGASFSIEFPSSDEMVPYIDEIKAVCLENVGALCHVTTLRDDSKTSSPLLTDYSEEKYYNIWSSFDSDLFEFKRKLQNIPQTGFCYAGYLTCTVDIGTGDMRQCYRAELLDNIYIDLDKPLYFEPVGHNCPDSYCTVGHALLAFGVIPESNIAKDVTYSTLRNRTCLNGTEWLTHRMKIFMGSKLKRPDIIEILQQYFKRETWLFYSLVKRKFGDKIPVIITALNKQNEMAEGNEIHIVDVMVDDISIPLTHIFEKKWIITEQEGGRRYIWRTYNKPETMTETLKGKLPKGKSICIVFEQDKWRGIAEVEIFGIKQVIDCYSENDTKLQVCVNSEARKIPPPPPV